MAKKRKGDAKEAEPPIPEPDEVRLPHLSEAFFRWLPLQLFTEAMSAYGGWLEMEDANKRRRSRRRTDLSESMADEMIVEARFERAIRSLAIQGRMWRMDVSAADDFMAKHFRRGQIDMAELMYRLRRFMQHFQDEAEAQWRLLEETPSKTKGGLKPMQHACAIVAHNPDITNRELARRVGVHESTVSRDKKVKAIRAMHRSERRRGFVSRDAGGADAEA